MKYTIKDLREGKCAVINDGTYEELDIVLSEAQGEPCNRVYVKSSSKYFWTDDSYYFWYNCNKTTLPTQSVKDFLEMNTKKQFPRVMLVSDYNDISTSKKRVVFMVKKNRYLAWSNVSTIEEAEKTVNARTWKYAWELEEKLIFPFNLSPKDAQSIIDVACSSWKDKLADKWAVNIVKNENSVVTENEYNEMFSACTSEQKELFNKIFK